MGERANIDVEYLEGLEGTLRESLDGDSSLLGDDSSRIGSQIDRRCLSRVVPAHGPAGRAPPPTCLPSVPSDSRPIAVPLPDASPQNHRLRSSATPDQRASMVPPSSPRVPPRTCSSISTQSRTRSAPNRDGSLRDRAAKEQCTVEIKQQEPTGLASMSAHLMYSSSFLLALSAHVRTRGRRIYRAPPTTSLQQIRT